MSLELMNEISDNYLMAVEVHRSLADTLWFIYMPGFAMLHEYQLITENMTQRKIKRYISSTYNIFLSDKLPKNINITEPLLSGKNRKTLKMENTYEILRESFRIYNEWEESALKFYQKTASEILANGETSTFNFISNEIIKDVKKELDYLNDLIIGFNNMEWDLPTITDQQTNYIERYEKLIRNPFGKSKNYHRHNSALDPESRMSLLDQYSD